MIVLGVALFVIGLAASIEALQVIAVAPVAVGTVILIERSVGHTAGARLPNSGASRAQIKKVFRHHADETNEQIDNLHKVITPLDLKRSTAPRS